MAQLVEHNLAKVGVASSNLVIRSKRAQTKTRGNRVEWLSGPKQQPAKLSNHGFKSRLHLQVFYTWTIGAVVAHFLDMEGVTGSNPVSSTRNAYEENKEVL